MQSCSLPSNNARLPTLFFALHLPGHHVRMQNNIPVHSYECLFELIVLSLFASILSHLIRDLDLYNPPIQMARPHSLLELIADLPGCTTFCWLARARLSSPSSPPAHCPVFALFSTSTSPR